MTAHFVDRDSTATIARPGIVTSDTGDVIFVGSGDRVVRFVALSDDLFDRERLTVFGVQSPRQLICWANDNAPTLIRVPAADIAAVIDRRSHTEVPL